MNVQILQRLRSMDGAELRFRAAAAVRTRVHRARTAIAPETWKREALRLSEAAPQEAQNAVAAADWRGSHLALSRHYATRSARFPLDPTKLASLATTVRASFPFDTDRAERIVAGRYDLLGYRDVAAGSPPDWHRDPVHGSRAPLVFWDQVQYLDPALGDHKITWELNRHQHFLTLGRAYALTRDRRFYETFVRHLTDWIRKNPPLIGTNWASMLELAFRCLSWTWALHFFAEAAAPDDVEPWTIDLLLALDRQLTQVERNLSRYFSPNTHLTGEALALFVCGLALPELEHASRYADAGRDVLCAEVARQVLADGGHAELSAHYHRYSTDFYLLALSVARLCGDPAVPVLESAARRQAHFLRLLADDTGRLPLLGDDDGGQLFPICGRPPVDAADTLATAAVLLQDPTLFVGPIPEETWWACGTMLDIPSISGPPYQPVSAALEASGYYVSRNGRGDHLIFDAGRHGFLNGGHAHADALSVVITAGGDPVVVDPGTSTYTMDPAVRDRFRSTAMHNTVVVGGRAQSETLGPFHWRSRTDAECLVWQPGHGADYLEGVHAGYAPVLHYRAVFALHGRGWIIVDHLTGGSDDVSAAAMWHIHPGWQCVPAGPWLVELRAADRLLSIASSHPIARAADDRLHAYAPVYGRVELATCLETPVTGQPPVSICTVLSRSGDTPAVQRLELESKPPRSFAGAAFRIDLGGRSFAVLSSVGAAPPSVTCCWGPACVQTNGRAAVIDITESATELCVIPHGLASSVHRRGL